MGPTRRASLAFDPIGSPSRSAAKERKKTLVEINHRERFLRAKILYYGPAAGGKTTTLQTLHRLARGNCKPVIRRSQQFSVDAYRTLPFQADRVRYAVPRDAHTQVDVVRLRVAFYQFYSAQYTLLRSKALEEFRSRRRRSPYNTLLRYGDEITGTCIPIATWTDAFPFRQHQVRCQPRRPHGGSSPAGKSSAHMPDR